MSIKTLVDLVLDNADRVSSYALLLLLVALLAYVAYGFMMGKFPTVGALKKLEATLKVTNDTLDSTRKELVDARILHAAAVVRIEYLERDTLRKDAEISALRERVARLETELSMIPQSRRRRAATE